MNDRDAIELIRKAVDDRGGLWADMGAGTGTFTRALRSLLGPGNRIYAIDKDPAAVSELRKFAENVSAIQADFTKPFSLDGAERLDGILIANALHYVRAPEVVLARLVEMLNEGGRIVMVEYDRRAANPWVPYPIASTRWPALATNAGLENPRVTARRKSDYSGELYVAVADRSTSVGE